MILHKILTKLCCHDPNHPDGYGLTLLHTHQTNTIQSVFSRGLGFTLIELSVVLVIIGLIIGGVLMGRDLIDDAKMKSIMKGYDEVNIGITTFKVKYNALPGDMATATGIWGDSASGGETANGDGNGRFDFGCHAEERRVFEHLSLAMLYPGNYDADASVNPNAATIGPGNVFPISRFSSTLGITVGTPTYFNPADIWGKLNYKNLIYTLGAAGNCLDDGYKFTGRQSWEYDIKFDDGLPTTGKLVAFGGFLSCGDWASDPPVYASAETTLDCDLMYVMQGF